jgi:trimethylamine:corrinoid methyltransferase-like protein
MSNGLPSMDSPPLQGPCPERLFFTTLAIWSPARALLSEVSTGEEALALEEIMSVGPGGNHLGRPYTRDHYRGFWTTELLDKAAHDRWASAGASTLGERLKAKTHDLRNAEPQFRLSDAVRIALHEMVTETSAYEAEVVE